MSCRAAPRAGPLCPRTMEQQQQCAPSKRAPRLDRFFARKPLPRGSSLALEQSPGRAAISSRRNMLLLRWATREIADR